MQEAEQTKPKRNKKKPRRYIITESDDTTINKKRKKTSLEGMKAFFKEGEESEENDESNANYECSTDSYSDTEDEEVETEKCQKNNPTNNSLRGKTFKESKHRREHLKRKHPSNRNAIQSLLDSISACVNEETASVADQAKLTIFMPINFTT